MHFIVLIAACFVAIALIGCVAMALVATSPAPAPAPKDVFGFGALRPVPDKDLPPIRRYVARDHEHLAYRFYDSTADQTLLFVHGSSYHGRSYHELASSISSRGIAKVVLPNLRGHFLSGRHRGDIDYIGQLEDDIADLIADLRTQGIGGPIVLGGHSSGGGFVIRFAGGVYANTVSRFLMLSPVIPTSPTLRGRASGGWAQVHLRRIIGLLVLNSLGVRGFNALPVIDFNKPVEFWDGTETLSYSFRLNTSYHPRNRYGTDVRRLANRAAVFIGEHDEAVDAQRLQKLVAKESPLTQFKILPDLDHFGIFTSVAAHDEIANWLAQPLAL